MSTFSGFFINYRDYFMAIIKSFFAHFYCGKLRILKLFTPHIRRILFVFILFLFHQHSRHWFIRNLYFISLSSKERVEVKYEVDYVIMRRYIVCLWTQFCNDSNSSILCA